MSEVLCIGESMAVLVPETAGPLEDAECFHRIVGGAESNVACGLSALGVRTAWVSRVGADGFGRLLRAELTGRGVETSGVIVDPLRPTGIYVKEIGGATGSPHDLGAGNSKLHYYRRGSAASTLSPETLDQPEVATLLNQARLVHVSGITAVLGRAEGHEGGRRLIDALIDRRRPGQLVSFDLNWRPSLWRQAESPQQESPQQVLASLAGRADIVLLGADEAEQLFGTGDPERLRALLPDPRVLVVKDGARGVTAFDRADGDGADGARAVVEPALNVELVEPIGAGDAFAAGYLAGLLRGYDQRRRLRLGHVCAASALVVPGDHAAPPPAELLDALLSCPPSQWAATRVSSAGFVSAEVTR